MDLLRFKYITGFPQKMRNIDAGEWIRAGDDQAVAGLQAEQGFPGPQNRQGAFQTAEVEDKRVRGQHHANGRWKVSTKMRSLLHGAFRIVR